MIIEEYNKKPQSTLMDMTPLAPPATSNVVEVVQVADSTLENAAGEHSNTAESIEVIWCVNMPSETVLHLDSLENFCQSFGQVLATNDSEDYE